MVPTAPLTSRDGDASELMQRAIASHKQGDLDEAARLYKSLLAIDPSHFDACHMLGALALQRGEPNEAIELITAALKVRPDSFHALVDAGFLRWTAKRTIVRVDHDPYRNGSEVDLSHIIVRRRSAPDERA